jgi:hypothetical protein
LRLTLPGSDVPRQRIPAMGRTHGALLGRAAFRGESDLIRRPGAAGDYPTLADELLDDEHNPPTGTDEDRHTVGPGSRHRIS